MFLHKTWFVLAGVIALATVACAGEAVPPIEGPAQEATGTPTPASTDSPSVPTGEGSPVSPEPTQPEGTRTPAGDGPPASAEPTPDQGTGLPTGEGSSTPPTPTQTPTLPPLQVGGDVGNLAPAFTLKLADGSTVDQAALLAQGKPLLLYFFATW